MAILKIIGLAFGGFILFSFVAGMFSKATLSGTLKDYLSNKHNERNFLKGSLHDGNTVLEHLKGMDKAAVENFANEKDLTLHEISYTVYIWAMRHIQEGKVQEGFDLLHIAADHYLNPLAITKLARIYFHGPESFQQLGTINMEKDIEKSFYYINLAFNLTNLVKDHPDGNQTINLVVNNGLALMDSFHGMNVRGEFDQKATQSKFENEWNNTVQIFKTMYL